MGRNGQFSSLICRYKDDYLFVRVFGNGEKKVLAFHGFGQTGNIFNINPLPAGYTFYAFDLFFHGKSSVPSLSPPLVNHRFRYFLEDFFRQVPGDNFEVIGFSMGAKYALSVSHLFPEKINKLTLVAPDGLKRNFWYALATGNAITRRIFKQVSYHPKYFNRAALLLEKMHLIDGRLRKFAASQMDSVNDRRKVYKSWVFLRKLFFSAKNTAVIIETYNINIEVILGRYDKIITYAYVKELIDLVGKDKLKIIQNGHTNVLADYLRRHFS